eukprot:TRINITY_DN36391_c0_g1_i1.p1 TRINITY_DN36391_c0_g1~~TRINITY_DN36391_c0_g1_i1.p1  ORF type:complete len:547 (-),score=110.24 TRINITY_DN36391_c0_g1_i1:133-1773(-)
MALLQVGAAVAAVVALVIGLLEVEHAALRPLQKSLILSCAAVLDRFQDPLDNLAWATDFNGAMLPTTPVQGLELSPSSGSVPSDVGGVYLRVGPNSAHWPPTKRTHVFDGHGMVYSVRLMDGKVTYHCDYIKTPKYLFEQQEDQEWFTRIGEFNGVSGLIKAIVLDRWKMKYAGLKDIDMTAGNTAIALTPDKKVWALHQAGPPFRLRVQQTGEVQSLGSDRLGGTLNEAMSAHPKFDARTKETFYHGVDPKSQRLYVGRIADGVLKEEATLKVDPPVGLGFNHDMFITADYVVVIDGAMRFDPASIVKGASLWTFDTSQKLRFGVYPRAAANMTSDAFTWIEAAFAAEIVHTMFGYNEGDKIILWTSMCRHDAKRTEGVLGGMGLLYMTRLVIDVSSQTVTEELVEGGKDFITEFGRVREDRIAGEAQFGYSAMAPVAEGWKDFNFTGLLKWDLKEKRRSAVISFPPGVIGGEPIFIPRGAAEDDGYISLFQWNIESQTSSFVLYDAATFSETPVVELPVPWRVPLGFHGWWMSEDELQEHLLVQ